jgi:ABC-2 type transport system ATP-binding protein
VVAVHDLSFDVAPGRVTGFLGPNGAGKSTTMRMILGLDQPSSGSALVAGVPYSKLRSPLRTIGSLLDASAVDGGRTAADHLRWLAVSNDIELSRVGAVLSMVGLGDVADRRVATFSLGMRQRLGIAVALLKDPELLILDEPANGLDPAGIREVREPVRQLGDEGRTVFLSSHLLSEVEQVCDEVAIVSAGRTVMQGAVSDVLARARPAALWVKVTDLEGAMNVLRQAGLSTELDGDRIRVGVVIDQAESVTRMLVAADHFPTELRPVETTLEDAFFALTSRPTGDG